MMENYVMFKIMKSKYFSDVVDTCLLPDQVKVYSETNKNGVELVSAALYSGHTRNITPKQERVWS